MNVLVVGATGMVGQGVLRECLLDDDVKKVVTVGRHATEQKYSKLKEIVIDDLYDYSNVKQHLKGFQACFFCLGVSSIGMKEKDYTRVTYDLTIEAATVLSKLNNEMTFCYVSGAGTDSTEKGRIMWARVKGRTENHLRELPFKNVYLFRPGFIKPMHDTKNAYGVSKALGKIYPVLKLCFPKYVCTLEDLGNSMINVVKTGYPKTVLENMDIAAAAKQGLTAEQ